MASFYISEIFDSIDGEGKRTGYMATFIRLTGCNLRCSYCDTIYALDREKDAVEVLSENELYSRIKAYPWKRLTFTGGEPLLHPLINLLNRLGQEGYESNIETNGSVPLLEEKLDGRRPDNVFYTMDIKSLSSGMSQQMRWDNMKWLGPKDVVKFVVSGDKDLDQMKKVIDEYQLGGEEHPLVYVSPVFGAIEPKSLVDYVKAHQLANVCVQVQLHKVIWDPTMRGV